MGSGCSSSLAPISSSDRTKILKLKSVDDLTFTDIDTAWRAAKNQVTAKASSKIAAVRRTGWQTIRIFVSSTFRDFNAEREILVKKVFPDLRIWCQSRRLNLVECDLRWVKLGIMKKYFK